jgi:type IV pilus assembly protein PilC
LLVVGFMLNVIVPMFANIFKRFGGELPAITRKILGFSEFMSHHFLLVLLIIASIIIILLYIRKFEFYQRISSALLLKIPVLGNMTRKVYLARFCSTLHLLVSSRAPLVDSLNMIEKMIRFYPLTRAIHRLQIGLLAGRSLHETMQQHSIFDRQLISLVKVGEETGKLDILLKKLYEQYTEEVKFRTEQLNNILEPALIIGVGIMVLIILVAMYLPLFQLSTSIM